MERSAARIVRKLRAHGYEALFAGGWVRDFLLHRRPKDIDIATSAAPEEVLALFPSALVIGAQFGVVQVRSYGRPFEIATFRVEGPYFDGRHPSRVDFAGPREDARRRDFTINGLFYDPVAGRVLDFVQGRPDLKRRILRTIGDPGLRFEEDKLRMMRAIRFACDLGFRIDPTTWESIRQSAASITQVSPERIRDELFKILIGPAPDLGLELLQESKLLGVILPEVESLRGVQQPPEFHPEGDVFTHTRLTLRLLRRPSPVLALAALLHDIGKPPTYSVADRIRFDRHCEVGSQMAETVCRRLRLSSDDCAHVVTLIRHHLRFMNVRQMRRSTLIRFLRLPAFEDHMELHRADCLSSHRDLSSYRFCRDQIRALGLEKAPSPPLLTGRDLIEMGYTPGPLFGRILRCLEEMQLEGSLRDAEQAREFVRENYPGEKREKAP